MQGSLVVCLLFAAGTAAFSGDWSAVVPVAPEAEPRPVSVGESIVASDGETYLIVTTDERGTRALRADAEGRITSLESIPVADASELTQGHRELYGVAGNGSAWLISLDSATLLLHPDGEVATVNSMPAASLLSNGKSFLAWSPDRAQILSPGVPVAVIDRNALPDELRTASTNGDVYVVASIIGDAIFFNVVDDGGRTVFAKSRKFVDVPPDGTRRLRDVGIARVHANFRLAWLEHDSGSPQIAWRISSVDFTPACRPRRHSSRAGQVAIRSTTFSPLAAATRSHRGANAVCAGHGWSRTTGSRFAGCNFRRRRTPPWSCGSTPTATVTSPCGYPRTGCRFDSRGSLGKESRQRASSPSGRSASRRAGWMSNGTAPRTSFSGVGTTTSGVLVPRSSRYA